MQRWKRDISVCLFLVCTIQTILPCCAAENWSNDCSQACCKNGQHAVGFTIHQQCLCRSHSTNNSPIPPIKPPRPRSTCPYCQSTAIICNSGNIKIQTESNSQFVTIDYSSVYAQHQHACVEIAQLPQNCLSKSAISAQLGRLLL